MNAKFTMLFETKKQREEYRKLARSQQKSLGGLVRELLAKYAANGASDDSQAATSENAA